MSDEPTLAAKLKQGTGGALGLGIVLVLLPSALLYWGVDKLDGSRTVGLPVLAIYGIMLLFGSLALVATLFARLQLSDPKQALALPEGSIRAAIALSLIVLFAILSIMLYQSLSAGYEIPELTESEMQALTSALAERVVGVSSTCPKEAAPCDAAELRYAVRVRQISSPESDDFAKQLLILIGTLMTSVTSFYFGSRAAELQRPAEPEPPVAPSTAAVAAAGGGGDDDDGLGDGCDVPITNATPDEELPAATGGVA